MSSQQAGDGAVGACLPEVELHAEVLRAQVHRRPRQRFRVRREVVTEEVTVVVPRRREVLRIEELPLTEEGAPEDCVGSAAEVGGRPAADALVVVLSEEQPRVHLDVVPYERVSVGARRRVSSQQVSTALSREVLEVTGVVPVAPSPMT